MNYILYSLLPMLTPEFTIIAIAIAIAVAIELWSWQSPDTDRPAKIKIKLGRTAQILYFPVQMAFS